ncbi:putative major facilitator, sugar transporter, major facilitator superfamily [Lupinus albus]|uniref:Putative major facilitator, sugar transporter, major facilitator superfamily n=1 Tax=Lupinus albus TaxID=3870 RepID=A0A6A4QLH5_LUPAL|nr:putative major facilitator, sugar transporter, major facilitator superfamily [Lupinus albus]
MLYIKEEFNLDNDPKVEGLIVSMTFFTGTFVTIFSGKVSDMVGRRRMLIASSIMFFSNGMVMLNASSVKVILLARLLDGVAIALTATITPLYISEIAPPDIRGQLNTFPQFSSSSGMFVAYIMVFSLSLVDSPSWRAMLGVVSIPSVVFFLLAVFYLPESPPWLVSKGRISEAKKVLQRIRGVEDVSGELALLLEGMHPGGEDTTIEEYIVAPPSELISNQELGKDCIKLLAPNSQGVSMVAQPVMTGQGSISCGLLTMSRQGSAASLAAASFKVPIVNLFGSVHENVNTILDSAGSASKGLLIPNVASSSSIGDHENNSFCTSDYLHAPLLSRQCTMDKDKAFESKDALEGSSNSNLRSNNNSFSPSISPAGEIPINTNIGGGWQLAYKSAEAGGSGKQEGGQLQRVYLHADPNVVSRQGSFVSSSDSNDDGVEAFQATALVTQSFLGPTNDVMIRSEVAAKQTNWRALLEPGVRRALIVGIGLQILQQASGINGFLFYAPQMLEQAGVGALLSNLGISSTSSSLLVNVIISFSMLPCIAISMRLMDISGRRYVKTYAICLISINC